MRSAVRMLREEGWQARVNLGSLVVTWSRAAALQERTEATNQEERAEQDSGAPRDGSEHVHLLLRHAKTRKVPNGARHYQNWVVLDRTRRFDQTTSV